MKKTLLIATLVGICGLVRATTISAPSSLIGNGALNGNNAYSWGISIAVPSGQSVVSASIDFTGLKLVSANGTTGTLYTDLLNKPTSGVVASTDNDAAGDYWAGALPGKFTSVGTQTMNLNQTIATLTYVLTATQLTALNSYLLAGAGTFSIGFDPDCTYNLTGLSFTYTLGTTPKNVPDAAATALLAIVGLASLEIFRRKFAPVASKA